MDDKQTTIGLVELLDEVSHDFDELRKKHSSDYSIKNMTMFWELEKERLLLRHGSIAAVKRLRQIPRIRRTLLIFSIGWICMLIAQAILQLLIR